MSREQAALVIRTLTATNVMLAMLVGKIVISPILTGLLG